MIDCGRCGYEQMRREENGFVCGHCGKVYTAEEAEQREQAMNRLNRKRKLQIALMGGCMLFLIICAFLLPEYVDGRIGTGLMATATAFCTAFFVAALVVRILFGKERRSLYRDE